MARSSDIERKLINEYQYKNFGLVYKYIVTSASVLKPCAGWKPEPAVNPAPQ